MANTRTSTTSSRKPRSAARATSRPATTRRSPDVEAEEPEVGEAEAQEIEADGQYLTAVLCDEEVRIIPPSAWRSSWQRMLNQGDLDAFAEKVFHPEDYELYLEIDPTIVEFVEFTQEAAERVGEGLGKSSGPATSSKRTRRR